MQLAKKVLATLFVAAILVGSNIGPAQAHASLTSASPAAGQTLATAPQSVTLTFDDDLTQIEGQAVNEIKVFKSTGSEVDLGDSTVSGSTVTVSLAKISNGVFNVVYRVLSADGHPVSAQYQFKVTEAVVATKPSKQPSPQPSHSSGASDDATVGSTSTASPSPSPSPSPSVGQSASAEPTTSAEPVTTIAAAPTQTTSAEDKDRANPSSTSQQPMWWLLIGLAFVTLAGSVWLRRFWLARSADRRPGQN